jgi:hypothetical protein
MMERFASTKFLLCVAYMAIMAGLAFAGKPTKDVLELADALKWGVLAYCAANAGITMAAAIKGEPKPE